MSDKKDSAKKKVGAKANPLEAYGHPPESQVEGEVQLESKSVDYSDMKEDAFAKGFVKAAGSDDMDPYDNERNVERMQRGGFGPMHKGLGPIAREIDADDEGEDRA